MSQPLGEEISLAEFYKRRGEEPRVLQPVTMAEIASLDLSPAERDVILELQPEHEGAD